jgi:hypothetical protein
MLKWQRNGAPRKWDYYLFYLIGASFICHAIVLCGFYFFCKEQPLVFSIDAALLHDLPIVIVPFKKSCSLNTKSEIMHHTTGKSTTKKGTQLVASAAQKKQNIKQTKEQNKQR